MFASDRERFGQLNAALVSMLCHFEYLIGLMRTSVVSYVAFLKLPFVFLNSSSFGALIRKAAIRDRGISLVSSHIFIRRHEAFIKYANICNYFQSFYLTT